MQLTRRSMMKATAACVVGSVAVGTASGAASASHYDGVFRVGAGISDVTGPAAENNMMGHSTPAQVTAGIQLRLRSRAFVFDDGRGNHLAYVVVDICSVFISIHQGVMQRLHQQLPGVFTEKDVLITASHTHSGNAGTAWDIAYNASNFGWDQQAYDAEVDGIVESIVDAYRDLAPGELRLGASSVDGANRNRSMAAFVLNTPQEQLAFPDGLDKRSVSLRVIQRGVDRGVINWFGTHPTSLTNKNQLISGDNKGYAAYMWEKFGYGVDYNDARPSFVAAFAQPAMGDLTSTLDLKMGHGPTDDPQQNMRIIGQRVLEGAKEAFFAANTAIGTGIDTRLCWVDMGNVLVDGSYTPDGQPKRTAPGAIGFPMLGGSSEDGPGLEFLKEGMKNPYWEHFGGAKPPEKWMADAHGVKAIALPFGTMPIAPWAPNIVALQLIRLGNFYIISVPGEFTIVAGLRLRQSVAATLGVAVDNVLLQPYANGYNQYCTTPEEYQAQQYEGASVLYGQYTLCAYQQEFDRIARDMLNGVETPRGKAPVDLSHLEGFSILPTTWVGFQSTPMGKNFGDQLVAPAAAASTNSVVAAEFVTGHPKNNIRRNGTFAAVEMLNGDRWLQIMDDGDLDVVFKWRRTLPTAECVARIEWTITDTIAPGTYRIIHYADARTLSGTHVPIEAVSSPINVS